MIGVVTLLFRLPLEVMKTKIRNNLQVLELVGMVSRKDHYQELINAIVQVCRPQHSSLDFPSYTEECQCLTVSLLTLFICVVAIFLLCPTFHDKRTGSKSLMEVAFKAFSITF